MRNCPSFTPTQCANSTKGKGRQPNQVGWRPTFFRLSEDIDRERMRSLLRAMPQPEIFDSLLIQLRDLIVTRHPAKKLSTSELESLTRDHLGGAAVDEFGVWVYYPWSGRLVHLLDEPEFIELRTNRNQYKITPQEQATLAFKRVGVVGLSAGQSIAVTLALERSAGELRLADFDRIDLSNLNRLRAGVHAINVPKVLVTAREIAEIDPYLGIEIFPDGISEENINEFLIRWGKLDVVVEECDSLDIKLLVRDRARQLGIPVIMATSDRGMLDVERFDQQPTRPILHGLAGDLDAAALRSLTTEQKVPYVAKLLELPNTSSRLRASLLEVEETISNWPQLASSLTSGAGAATDAVRRILLDEPVPSGRFFSSCCREAADPPAAVIKPVATPNSICGDPAIRDLVAHAVLAPSAGNAQPWTWVAGEKQIDLFLDPERSSSLDFENSGSFTALGCATENLILAAHHGGLEVQLRTFPAGPKSCHTATFRLLQAGDTKGEPHWRDDLYYQIALRHTNRRIGPRQALAPEILEDLTAAVKSIPSIDVQWLITDNDLLQIGDLVGITDRLRLLSPKAHQELFSELRWTKEDVLTTGDGIDVETLDLSPSDRVGLEIIRDRRALDRIRSWGKGGKLERWGRRSIDASSAVGLIVAPSSRPLDFFNGGRAFQRFWLEATRRALFVHPIATLPYYMARLKRSRGEGLDGEMIRELARIRPRWEQLFPNPPSAGEVMLFRLWAGVEIESRSVRRPLDDVLSATGGRSSLSLALCGSSVLEGETAP
jgi:molybdopterin/thiamine biosynthesis adenylyltransferase